MKNKIIIPIAVILCVALVIGGVFGVLRLRRPAVPVYSAADFSMYDSFMNENYSYGTVHTDQLQTVYLSETQQVTEILVKEGQAVHTGDALLNFDTTLTDLQLEQKELEIRQLERSLEQARKDLTALSTITPSAPSEVSATAEDAVANLVPLRADTAPGVHLLSEVEPTDPADPDDPTPEPAPSDDPEPEPAPSDEPEPEPPPSDDPEPEPAPSDEPEGTEKPDAKPTEPPTSSAPSVQGDPPTADGVVKSYWRVGGDGSFGAPYLYLFSGSLPFEDSFITALLENHTQVYAVFAQSEENLVDGMVEAAWGICFTAKAGGGYRFNFFDTSDYLGRPLGTELPEEPEIEEPLLPDAPTPEELARQRAEVESKIRDLDLQIRLAEHELKQMQQEMGDGTIYAEVDGMVLELSNPDTAYRDNVPVVKISGGAGYYVEASVSELKLETLSVGQTVQVDAWYSGTSCEGVIDSISSVPSDEGRYYSSESNPNVTFYTFTVFIDASENLQSNEDVEITFQTGGEAIAETFYLEKPFVLQENGKSYVYVLGEDDLLEKREILTGKDLWGSYLEIRSGLTQDDQIAFPYGKNVFEGAKTREGTMEEFYGY